MSGMLDLMTSRISFGSFSVVMLSNYVAFAHLLGGALLTLGLLTRFACLLQIPILLGAVFLVNATGNFLQPFSELYLSILVLLLLVYFLIVGNGPWAFKLSSEKEKE
jgi:putative oxidoreductase